MPSLSLSADAREAIESAAQKAVYTRGQDFQLMSLRTVDMTHEGLLNSDLCFYLSETFLYQVVKQKIAEQTTYASLTEKIDDQIEHLRRVLLVFTEHIDDLEDALFERSPPRHFLGTWFRLRKDLSILDRAFGRNAVVLHEFFKANEDALSKEAAALRANIKHFESGKRSCDVEARRLDGIFHFYTSLKSDKMNGNVYLLALVSGIFLPLHLIVGFFGINTENLYFAGNPNGTNYVLWIVIGLFIGLMIGLPALRLLEHFLYKNIFGKSRLYRSIRARIEKLRMELE